MEVFCYSESKNIKNNITILVSMYAVISIEFFLSI